jgi:excisionase family DNA binding protein
MHTPHKEIDLALSLTEASAALRMSESWLRRECKAGRFPHVRCGRRLLFRPAAVDAWLQARERSSNAVP